MPTSWCDKRIDELKAEIEQLRGAIVNTYRGHLFGHYDSRGGTTFVVTEDKADALRHYAKAFGFDEATWDEDWKDVGPADDKDWTYAIAVKGLEEEDYLGFAILTSEVDIDDLVNQRGFDLDSQFSGDNLDVDQDFDEEGNAKDHVTTARVLGQRPTQNDGCDWADGFFLAEWIAANPGAPISIHYGPKPKDVPSFIPRWDDDAFGLIFDRPPPKPRFDTVNPPTSELAQRRRDHT